MRRILIFAGLVLVVSETCASQSSGDTQLKRWVIQPPTNGVYTGASVGENSNEGSCAGLGRAVGQAMQFCNVQHSIYDLPDLLTDGKATAMGAAGTIPVVTLGCKGNGTPETRGRIGFATVAAGADDASLKQDAEALKAYAARFPKNPWIMMRPFHEFNVNIGNPRGNPNKNNCYSMPETLSQMQEEFKAAFRHVVTTFASQGVTNVTWVWCSAVGPATWQKYGGDDILRGFYPGDAYVDWTCGDAYDKPSPGGGVARTFQHIGVFAQFHKPVLIAETGECNSDIPRSRRCQGYTETQAAFIADLKTALQPGGSLADSGIEAWLYFDQSVPYSGYNWSLDGAGLEAFRALINTPYFHPPMPPPRWTE